MKVEGYVGICGACFEPIKKGEEIKFRENGSYFHRKCAEQKPNSYYVALERIRGQFEQGVDPTELMNDMERIFKMTELNENNKDVMSLYREISNSRQFD